MSFNFKRAESVKYSGVILGFRLEKTNRNKRGDCRKNVYFNFIFHSKDIPSFGLFSKVQNYSKFPVNFNWFLNIKLTSFIGISSKIFLLFFRKRLWRLFRNGGSGNPSESLLLLMMEMKRIAIKI